MNAECLSPRKGWARRGLLLVASALLPILLAIPLAAADDLDAFIAARMAQARLPGLSACVVRDGQVALARGYGFADVGNQVPVTPDTLFILASVSKPVTATALMQLHEAGRFGLDDPIGPHLPFPVVNPGHPEVPVTFRELLAHTASLEDNLFRLMRLIGKGDSRIPLETFLRDYLAPGGKHYRAKRSYNKNYAPGEHYSYCNVGYALCGLLVESLSGQPFDAYSAQHNFEPLGMGEAGWFLEGLDASRVAIPYKSKGPARFRPYGHLGFPFYPAGQLRTSAPQLARFLLAHMNGGELDGVRILGPDTAEAMHAVQFPDLDPNYGLGFVRVEGGGGIYIGHNGLLPGTRTEMYYEALSGVGVVLLTNGDVMDETAWAEIFWRLFEEGGLSVSTPPHLAKAPGTLAIAAE